MRSTSPAAAAALVAVLLAGVFGGGVRAAVGAVPAQVPAPAPAGWQEVPPLVPPDASPADPPAVTGVACPVADACALSGSYRTSEGAPAGFVATSDAGAVTVLAAPAPADAATGADAELNLGDIACATAGDCVAVGAYRATDGHLHPLVETLSGSGWTPVAVALPGGVDAISVQVLDAACDATECAAIGSYQVVSGQSRGLAMVRDGSGAWQAEDVTLPAGAVTAQGLGVACPASGTCVGYGTVDERPVLLYPSTGAWRAVYLPVPPDVDSTTLDVRGMACTAPADCVALGSYAHPDGQGRGVVAEWLRAGVLSVSTVRLPDSLGHRAIGTGPISCPAAGSCAAVGRVGAPDHPSAAVLFMLRDRRWTAAAAPVPSGLMAGGSTALNALACPAVGSCTAVGGFDRQRQVHHVLQRPYAVRLAGGTWRAVGLGRPGGLAGIVSGALFVLSCAGPTCLSAGTDVRYDAQGGVLKYGAFADRRG